MFPPCLLPPSAQTTQGLTALPSALCRPAATGRHLFPAWVAPHNCLALTSALLYSEVQEGWDRPVRPSEIPQTQNITPFHAPGPLNRETPPISDSEALARCLLRTLHFSEEPREKNPGASMSTDFAAQNHGQPPATAQGTLPTQPPETMPARCFLSVHRTFNTKTRGSS